MNAKKRFEEAAPMLKAWADEKASTEAEIRSWLASPEAAKLVRQEGQFRALIARQLDGIGMDAWTPTDLDGWGALAGCLGINPGPMNMEEIQREVIKAIREMRTVTAAPAPPDIIGKAGKKTKGKNIANKMATILMEESANCIDWSMKYWSELLNCSQSSINDSPTWSKIMGIRTMIALERKTEKIDRRKQKRKSDSE